MPDEHLLPRIAAGDRSAVAACLDRYGGLVWSLALRFFSDRTTAEDVVQEVFIDLWRNAARFDARVASEATFVTLLARRRLIDRRRRESSRPAAEPLGDLPAAATTTNAVDVRDEADRALRAMALLPEAQFRALRLSIHRGLTHEEIAREMALPLGTVKAHLRRGLIRLREILEGGVS